MMTKEQQKTRLKAILAKKRLLEKDPIALKFKKADKLARRK